MTQSTGKKKLQTFHARDTMWEIFSKYAKQIDCSVDYLINEAMHMYASNQGFLEQEIMIKEVDPILPKPPVSKSKDLAPTIREKPSVKLPRPREHAASGVTLNPVEEAEQKVKSTSLPRPGGSSVAAALSAIPRPDGTSPIPKTSAQTSGEGSDRPTLTLIFQGQKIPVLQDQFIIGRGTKSADLPIKDVNISRKHAAIIFHNGAFYMKDLGSTNGIDFKGAPVDSKRIDEGDVFSICGFDIHFTYNP